ncbi:hypothetical protein, partial [Pseudomonas lopnurensis]|uniref:hypothetical protein n=1 Tax=Pseudomonas lopnurensis TaxID=1477517 RepID=UPI0028B0B226
MAIASKTALIKHKITLCFDWINFRDLASLQGGQRRSLAHASAGYERDPFAPPVGARLRAIGRNADDRRQG